MQESRPKRARPEERESNVQVLSMGTSLFGILMGVWWGTLTRGIFSDVGQQSPIFPSLPLSTLRWAYVVSSIICGALVIYYFARWAWTLADITLDVRLRELLPLLQTIMEYVLAIPLATLIYGFTAAVAFGISPALGAAGGMLLFTWMVTSVGLVQWKLRYDERRAKEWGE